MASTPTGVGAMTDPKQLLDEEIEEALMEEQVVMTTPQRTTPKPWNQVGAFVIDGKWARPLTVALGVGVAASSIALVIARVRAHRTPHFKDIVLHARRPRRFGYSRVRFGRFGQAVLTYTYKIPAVRIHIPRFTYKIPPMRVKLPVSSR